MASVIRKSTKSTCCIWPSDNLSINEPFFQGHFPGHPIMPGVLIIEAMAQTPNVCPNLHMPLQSGSDRILRAMRRSYRADKYLGILDRVRAAMPDAAITTDIIVGFPGETDEDFEQTLDVVRKGPAGKSKIFKTYEKPGAREKLGWLYWTLGRTDEVTAQLARARDINATRKIGDAVRQHHAVFKGFCLGHAKTPKNN